VSGKEASTDEKDASESGLLSREPVACGGDDVVVSEMGEHSLGHTEKGTISTQWLSPSMILFGFSNWSYSRHFY